MILISFTAATLAVLLLRVNLIPYQRVPLTVGNYVGAFFLLYGLVVGIYTWLKKRESVPSRNIALTH